MSCANNGLIPRNELAPIAGGGYLRRDAAAAWNALNRHLLARGYAPKYHGGAAIGVKGPDSSYRPYSRQVYWRNYWCSQGKCQNAADPGTSNHGCGLAVDVDPYVRSLIDQYGEPFGFSKRWSDAPWEPWHIKYEEGHYRPDPHLITVGERSARVLLLTHRLAVAGYLRHSGRFYSLHVADQVRRFQRDHHLPVDGEAGTRTRGEIKAAAQRARLR